jgi:pimeloyl-ACP methyl ester carboxylesterase
VLQALIAGKSIAQIARARKTSVETVRTQTRAVLRKTETRSQAELMRLLAVLAQFCARHGNRNGSGWQNSESRFARLSVRERSLAFAQFGDTKGRPVLFVHGMIDGCSAPLFNESRLKDRNIRLIVPARPGYGASDPATSAEIAGFFAEDMRLLLDHLGVEHCTILGHFGGALYAYAVAGTNAERVRAVINVAGTVPITSLAQVAAFGPRQRIIAYTSRFAPAISRLILRAGVALLDSGGHRAFMSALYEKSVLDRAVAERADVYPFLADGYHFSAAQGHGAFEADAVRTISDWSELVNKVSVPVRLVHGRHDPAMPISLVREFAARRGNVELCEIGDAGQLVFFSHPDRVFDILEDVLSDRRIASVPR